MLTSHNSWFSDKISSNFMLTSKNYTQMNLKLKVKNIVWGFKGHWLEPVYIYIKNNIYLYTYIHIRISIHIYTYIHTHIYIYIYIYIPGVPVKSLRIYFCLFLFKYFIYGFNFSAQYITDHFLIDSKSCFIVSSSCL